jgi:hypothetical protein
LGLKVVEIIEIPYKTMKKGQNLDAQKNRMVSKKIPYFELILGLK